MQALTFFFKREEPGMSRLSRAVDSCPEQWSFLTGVRLLSGCLENLSCLVNTLNKMFD